MKRYITEEQNDIKVGDVILGGKFKNKRMIVKGFGTDKNGQPTIKTDKGEVPMYKVRIEKLLPKKKEKGGISSKYKFIVFIGDKQRMKRYTTLQEELLDGQVSNSKRQETNAYCNGQV